MQPRQKYIGVYGKRSKIRDLNTPGTSLIYRDVLIN